MKRSASEIQYEWIGDNTNTTTVANTSVKLAVADDGQIVLIAPPGAGVTPSFNASTKNITNGASSGSALRKILSLEIDASQIVSGITSISNGGTGISTAATPGGILYGVSSTTLGYSTATTAGRVLLSGGTSAPTWTTGTLALSGNFSISGAFAVALTATAGTTLTLPTSGILATEQYVTNKLNGITWKESVKVATVAALSGTVYNYNNGTSGVGATLTPVSAQSATSFIDGVTILNGDRILIKNQVTALQNGIYYATVSGGNVTLLTRSLDADESSDMVNASVLVYSGTVNDNRQYTTQNPTVTIGTTAIDWIQISGPGTSVALSNSSIFVGNVSGIATSVSMSGDATISNTGAITLANANAGGTTYTLTFAGGTTANIFSYDIKGRITGNTASSISINLDSADVTGNLNVGKGGTGFTSYTTGDLIYASSTNTLSKLSATTNTYILTLVAGLPTWIAPTPSFSVGNIGVSPNVNGLTFAGGILNLEPASASFGGVITTGTQTFAGAKTFNDNVITISDFKLGGTTSIISHVGTSTVANVFSGTTSTLTSLNLGTDNSLVTVNIGANNASTVVTIGGAAGGVLKAIVKDFDITDPRYNDPNLRLVHACIESNENGVYYRGESKLVEGVVEINLPDWFEDLTKEENRTIQLTPLFEDRLIEQIAPSKIINGKFTVHGMGRINGDQEFYWEVKAVRKDIPTLVAEQQLNF
jgi:hypothetical protein